MSAIPTIHKCYILILPGCHMRRIGRRFRSKQMLKSNQYLSNPMTGISKGPYPSIQRQMKNIIAPCTDHKTCFVVRPLRPLKASQPPLTSLWAHKAHWIPGRPLYDYGPRGFMSAPPPIRPRKERSAAIRVHHAAMVGADHSASAERPGWLH